jgi:phosphoglycerate dehydrogenase-like enzyme
VADHAIALVMTLAKSVAYHDQMLREDLKANWRPAHNPFGRRLSACTFGVIGAGRIGTAAMRRAAAFDMDVVFFDPYVPSGYELALGVRRADSLAELMGQCDIVSVHAPLNAETRGLVGADAFAAAKKGLILVNTARGGIVDEAALEAALDSGHLAGAALDVFETEPPPPDYRLRRHPKVICTPHVSGVTDGSLVNMGLMAAECIAARLSGGTVPPERIVFAAS